mmetsp:Transcript_3288/g.11001  ORF Transcript_3288/g.11001 Transcript_3288/m.11001 type:complete len:234 (+) Transcript_3288:1505-2206(+)
MKRRRVLDAHTARRVARSRGDVQISQGRVVDRRGGRRRRQHEDILRARLEHAHVDRDRRLLRVAVHGPDGALDDFDKFRRPGGVRLVVDRYRVSIHGRFRRGNRYRDVIRSRGEVEIVRLPPGRENRRRRRSRRSLDDGNRTEVQKVLVEREPRGIHPTFLRYPRHQRRRVRRVRENRLHHRVHVPRAGFIRRRHVREHVNVRDRGITHEILYLHLDRLPEERIERPYRVDSS